MAGSLRKIAQGVEEIRESRWRFIDGIDEFSERNVEELCFQGELDGFDLFMIAPVTFVNSKTGRSENMTPDEIHEFFDTGDIDGKEDWVIDTWLVIRFDLKREYIRIYKTSKVDLSKSPRDNYEIEYSRVKEFIDFHDPVGLLPQIYEMRLRDYEFADPWLDLKDATEFQADNRRYDTDLPIDVKRSRFFHALNRRILDDEYEKSGPDEKILLSDNFKMMKIRHETIASLRGVQFETPFFETKIQFTSGRDLIDYTLSVFRWIRNHMNFDFSHILKVNESNRWGMNGPDGIRSPAPGGPDLEFHPADYSKFEFRSCNVGGAPIVEAEVWENGSVYTYRNHRDGVPVFYSREEE
jgi:hypothetical protein